MPSSLRNARVVVVGVGAVGGTVAARLARAGVDVTALTRNTEVVHAIRRRGFELVADGERRAVRGRAETALGSDERFDLALLATQPQQVEGAARAILPHLDASAPLVCLQNGLCEARVAPIAGSERVLGAIVSWGASMPAPGVYEKTASGEFTLGRLSEGSEEDLREVGSILESVAPVAYTANLEGARWSKLALNSAISSLGTLAGERLGGLLRVRRYRRLALEIFTEAVEVARAEGVDLEKVAGTLDVSWIALSAAERERAASPGLTAKHALLLGVGLRYRRLRSSMLAAIERGREPAIDSLNGEVVERGRRRGVPAPVNAAVTEGVRALGRGEGRPAREHLDQIYERTRLRKAA